MINRPIRARQSRMPSRHVNFKRVKTITTISIQKTTRIRPSRVLIATTFRRQCIPAKKTRRCPRAQCRRAFEKPREKVLLPPHPHEIILAPNPPRRRQESTPLRRILCSRVRPHKQPAIPDQRRQSRQPPSLWTPKTTSFPSQTCPGLLSTVHRGQRKRIVKIGPIFSYRHGSSP